VGSYAVIDAGFGVVHEDGSSSPAGFYLRQAQHRVENDSAWLDLDKRMYLQSILHRYGIDPNKNIQGTTSGDIFDFGHFIVRDDLPTTLPAKQVPFDLWGYDKSIVGSQYDKWFYSKQDHPWFWSHELADAFASGRASRHDAWTHFENLIKPARAKLTTFREVKYALHRYVASRDVANYLRRMIIEKNIFILDNIKHNLATDGHMDTPLWKNVDVLVELNRSLKFLPPDDEVLKVQKQIAATALEMKSYSKTEFPQELLILMEKFNAPTVQNNQSTCFGMASAIMQH
jgi:hypothetical protein